MDRTTLSRVLMLVAVALVLGSAPALADNLIVQCPGDTDGDAAWNSLGEVQPDGVLCKHLTAGDGWVTMADDGATPLYIFGFSDVTGVQPDLVPVEGILRAEFPAPTIVLDEGYHFYLTLTNAGMLLRPDLFDPHSVHFHGFPQAAPIFDGLPESAVVINMGSSITYYYQLNDPGTYMYHCHVEATEHMQMGMLGNLYVRPAQNGTSYEYPLLSGKFYTKFAYNDGDGSTGYDREFPIQIGSFDSDFHIKHIDVQPLPFAMMRDDYPMLNGRGYPDTVNTGDLGVPVDPVTGDCLNCAPGEPLLSGHHSQLVNSLIEANEGERVLLRISNLNVTRFYTLATAGIPMNVIGRDAKLLRGPSGADLSYVTSSVTLGGGESVDAIFTAPAYVGLGTDPWDTYFVYTTNLNCLVNGDETAAGMGGMMTEIHVYPAGTLAPQAATAPGGPVAARRGIQMALGTE